MKNIFLLLLLFTGMVEAQIVSIPDVNFKARLLAADITNAIAKDINLNSIHIDINNNGEIEISEVQNVYYLDLSILITSNISNLSGIISFSNLSWLDCRFNNLTNINLAGLNNLAYLNCSQNNFSTLNLTDLPNLVTLYCIQSNLTSLDLSGLSNLNEINVCCNNLTSLNISLLSNLTSITCNNNQINQLNLGSLPNLITLKCNNNLLTSLDLSSGVNNLQTVNCTSNQLTSLNLLGLNNLTKLDCGSNLLNNINLTGLNNLLNLGCGSNLISNLNLSGINNLLSLSCGGNQLTNLDLSNLDSLKFLYCDFNQLTNLDLHLLSNLSTFSCDSNFLSVINVSGLTNLTNFVCSGNQLMSLELDSLINLNYFICDNNPLLQTIFMKNGINQFIGETHFINCPNLVYICSDESEVVNLNNYLNSISLPNTVVNSYCSFTPGGNYNIITGNLKFDINNNGCDASDIIFPNVRVNINDDSSNGASFSNSLGNYTFYTQTGSFDITLGIENPTWFTFFPTTVTIPFANNNNNTVNQDFCIAPNGIHPDIEVVISPVFFARPGFDATYQITYRNKGNQTVSGALNLIFDDSKTDFVSANPSVDNLAINSLSWNYSSLLPFESRNITVTLNVNSPTETPAVNIGDVLNFEVTITPVIGDELPEDNLFSYNQTVVGSYDPNDITCLEGDVVPPTEIGNYLHYAINFENTGTFPAENVVVKTEVDLAKFDIGSLQLMNSNFPVDARITGNKVEFIYENIQLPIGGHGHILLKIKTQNTLVTGDAVANRGDIFFDYNFPIDTGLANTVFQMLSNSVFEIDNSVAVYPNPTTTQINIKSDTTIQTIQIYDIQGRILQTKLVNEKQSTIDLTQKSKGIYFFKISTDKGSKIEKVIKE